jgi:hypothetical protein
MLNCPTGWMDEKAALVDTSAQLLHYNFMRMLLVCVKRGKTIRKHFYLP